MPLNPATLTPASIKAKNVATEDYVDTSTDAFAANVYYPNTTEIDGGKIRTNTINADRIIAGTSMSAPLINGGTINGGTINGVNITGSVIKSSWIDYTSNGVLTNWQHFIPTTTPGTYVNNFAKDSTTGELIVDSLGYTRLPKVLGFVLSGYINSSYDPNTSYTFSKIYDIVPYDDYTVNNLNRPFNADVTFQVLGENVSSITLLSKFLDSYNGNGLSNTTIFTFYLGNTVVVVNSYWKFNSGAVNTNNVTVSVDGTNTYSGNLYSDPYDQNFGIFTLFIQPGYSMVLSMSVSSQTITFSNFTLGNSSKFGVVIDATINDNNDMPISFNLPTLKEI